jgi:hypothetical protein
MIKRMFTRGLVALTLIMALAMTPTTFAADPDPTGTWDISIDMAGQEVLATMVVTSNDDGTLNGSLSSAMGDFDFDSVAFKGSELSFKQTIGEGDDALTFEFTGQLKGDSFAGMLNSDMGEMAVKGTRAVPGTAIFGTWKLILVLNEDITGTVGDIKVTDLTVSQEKIAFELTLATEGESMNFEIELSLDGDKLIGEAYVNSESAAEIEGTLEEAGSKSESSVFGSWAIASSSEAGELKHTLVLNNNLTGTIDGNEITDLTISSGEISFEFTMSVEGESMDLEIDASIEGKEMSGEAYVNGDSVAELSGVKSYDTIAKKE